MKLLTLNKLWLQRKERSPLHVRSTSLHVLSVGRKLHSSYFLTSFHMKKVTKKAAKTVKKMPMKKAMKGKCK